MSRSLSTSLKSPPNHRYSIAKNHPPRISLCIYQPVFQEYTHIDLKKTTSYQRIDRKKPKSRHNTQKGENQGEQFGEGKQQAMQANVDKRWQEKIRQYMEVKEKSLGKWEEDEGEGAWKEGFPLMRLSKKNELLRKMKTNEKFAGKPEIVHDLQTQQMFYEKPLAKTKPLPQLPHSRHSKPFPSPSNHQNSHPSQRQFFKSVIQKANKSEKVLINFIGKYFKQKFSPQKRYSHQVERGRVEGSNNEEVIRLRISNLFERDGGKGRGQTEREG